MPIVRKGTKVRQKSYTRSRRLNRLIYRLPSLLQHMSLDELLELSAYVDMLIHGECAQLPNGGLQRVCASRIAQIKDSCDLRVIMFLISSEIVKKNQKTVNRETAQKVYDDFMRSD